MSEEIFDMDNIEFIDPTEVSSVQDLVDQPTDPVEKKEPIVDDDEPITINLDEEIDDEGDEPVVKTPKPREKKEEKKEDKSSTFKVLAEALVEEGIFTEIPEDFSGDAGEFLNLFKMEQMKGAESIFENFLNQLPPKLKRAVSSYSNGLDEDSSFEIAENLEKYTSIDQDTLEENIDLQKSIYREALIKKGFSKEKAEKYIKRAEDNDDLFDESLESLDELKAFYEKEETRRKQEIAERNKAIEQEHRRQLESIKNDVESSDEIVPGLKINKKIQETLFKSMTEIVGKDEYGNPMNAVMKTRAKNPLAFEKGIHYYHMLGLFNIDEKGNFKPDLSKLMTVSKSKAISELEKKIKTEPLKGGRSMDLDEDSDILKAFESHFS